MPPLRQPPRDVADPDKLYQHLRSVHADMLRMQETVKTLQTAIDNERTRNFTHQELSEVRDALSSTGAAPLPLTGLTGRASTPQLPVPIYAASAAELNAKHPPSVLLKGTMALVTTAPITVYFVGVDAHGAHVWTGP